MRRLLLLALLCLALPARAQVMTPLTGEVPFAPVAFTGTDLQQHLVWELRLANATPAAGQLHAVTVRDAGSGAELLRLDGAALAGRFGLGIGRGGELTVIGPQQWGIVFLHLALPTTTPLPRRLVHEVVAGFAAPVGASMTMQMGETLVVVQSLPVLGPPLRGARYVAGDGCCDSIRHVRAVLPLDGGLRVAQRFAIDWERVGPDDRIFTGDPRDPSSYHIHNAEVLAVGDGTVVAARDGLPEQVPGKLPEGLPLDQADGNFVVLRLDRSGAHVLYAHLLRGSVGPRTDARVTRGQVIGRVGNSGNTQAPHLHLHVMDGPSPLLANGIPYIFDTGTVTGQVQGGTAAFDAAEAHGTPLPIAAVPPVPLHSKLPMDLSIVDWGP